MKRRCIIYCFLFLCAPMVLYSDTADKFSPGSMMLGGSGNVQFNVNDPLSGDSTFYTSLYLSPNIGFFPVEFLLIRIDPGVYLSWLPAWEQSLEVEISGDLQVDYFVPLIENLYFYFGLGGGIIFQLPLGGNSSDFDFYVYLPLGFEAFLTESAALSIEPWVTLRMWDIDYKEEWDVYTGVSVGLHYYVASEGITFSNH